MTQEKMSPLRARMIEDMRIRGLGDTRGVARLPASYERYRGHTFGLQRPDHGPAVLLWDDLQS